MKPSPIDLLDSVFEKISVESNPEHAQAEGDSNRFSIADLEFHTAITPLPEYWTRHEPPAPEVVDRTFAVQLGLRTSPGEDKKYAYDFEVICSCVVMCKKERVTQNLSAKDAASEYGLSLLYGMVREQLQYMTARMPYGSWMLPTVSFMGDSTKRKSAAEPQQEAQSAKPLEGDKAK